MKKSIAFFLLFICTFTFPLNVISQSDCGTDCEELLENPNLDWDSVDPFFLHEAFPDGIVTDWLSSINSPHLLYTDVDGNCPFGSYNPSSQNEPLFNCLASFYKQNVPAGGVKGYMEGVFTEVNFIGDPSLSYSITGNANLIDCNVNDESYSILEFRAANGVIQNTTYDFGNLPATPPAYSSMDDIGSEIINSFNTQPFQFDFVPDADYSSLEIYNTVDYVGQSWVSVNNVNITCTTSSLTGINSDINNLLCMFSAQNSSSIGYTEYNWCFGDDNFSNEPSPNHLYDDYGSYDVCVDIINEAGCCATVCDEIIISPPPTSCPMDNETIFIDADVTNSFSDLVEMGMYQSGGTLTGKDIVIKGPFILDENFSFIGCHFYFEPGSELIVRSPGNIVIKYGTLEGCTEMWKGITVDGDLQNPSNRFNFKYNTISDAYHALDLLDGANIQIRYITFDSNYIGIYSAANGGVKKSYFGSEIAKCRFISTKPMLLPYFGSSIWDETKLGILLEDFSHLIVDDCEFIDIDNGIYSKNANVLVNKCEFRELSSDGPYNGRGIESTKSGNLSIVDCEFEEVELPIWIYLGNSRIIKILDNYFYPGENTESIASHDVLISTTHSSKINVENNVFINQNLAVENCNSLGRLKVHNNNFSDYHYNIYPLVLGGLHKVFGAEGVVSLNTYEQGFNNSRGFSFNGLDNFEIFNNRIIANDEDYNFSAMISLSNSENCLVHDNILEYQEGYGNGLWVRQCPGNIYCCNTIKNVKEGIRFTGQNKDTELRSTVFENSTYGIWLNDAEIGDQNLYGNLWTGNTNSRAVFEVGNGDINAFQNSIFRVNPSQSGTMPMHATNETGTQLDWFRQIGGSAYLCPQNNINEACGSTNWDGFNFDAPPPSGDPCEKILQELVDLVGPEIYWNFQNQNDWVFFTYVFDNYKDIPVELWGDCYLYEDRDVNIKTVAEYYHTDKRYKEAHLMTESENIQLDQYQNDYESEIGSLNNLFSQVEDDNDYQIHSTDIISVQNNIANLATQINNISNAVKTRGESNLTMLQGHIDNLPLDFDFLANIKFVWKMKIRIALNGVDDIKSNEWDQLRVIANSCVLENIDAVFEAQSLLSLIGENEFSGNEVCSSTKKRNENQANIDVKIYPNPSNGIYHLESDKVEMLRLKVIVTDINGRNINSKFNLSNSTIDLLNQPNGVYFIKVLQSNTVIHHQKLILIK